MSPVYVSTDINALFGAIKWMLARWCSLIIALIFHKQTNSSLRLNCYAYSNHLLWEHLVISHLTAGFHNSKYIFEQMEQKGQSEEFSHFGGKNNWMISMVTTESKESGHGQVTYGDLPLPAKGISLSIQAIKLQWKLWFM